MAFWTPILIWLAKILIQHFLNTQIDLKRQLQDALDRNQQHQEALKVAEETGVHLQAELDEKNARIAELGSEIHLATQHIIDLDKEKNEKLKESVNRIDNMDDSAVLHSDLRSDVQ